MKIKKRGALADPSSEIMTVRQLAEYLRSHPSTIYRLLKNREIPAFKLGGSWCLDRAVIDQWIKKTTRSPRVAGATGAQGSTTGKVEMNDDEHRPDSRAWLTSR